MQISLKAARVNCGLTQTEAASEIGVSVATLKSWENGKTFPNALHILNIERVYHVGFHDLLFERK